MNKCIFLLESIPLPCAIYRPLPEMAGIQNILFPRQKKSKLYIAKNYIAKECPSAFLDLHKGKLSSLKRFCGRTYFIGGKVYV